MSTVSSEVSSSLATLPAVDIPSDPQATLHSGAQSSEEGEEPQINFEGPEKVLEVWFVPPNEYEEDNAAAAAVASDKSNAAKESETAAVESAAGNPSSSSSQSSSPRDSSPNPPARRFLRSVPKHVWQEMLDLVHCQILSTISNDKGDAYLLSESSMFVYEYQIVLKTCGTTTLLNCLGRLLEIAASVGLTKVDDVFYNRQNFFFPDKQLGPHKGFDAECRILDQYFKNGGAYIIGRVNENHYNFYNAECKMHRNDPAMLERDNTLEILMTGLDPVAMKQFYFTEGVSTAEVREKSGIADFFPGALIDDFMFEPFGYSLNGLVPDGYFTIHVTPQPNCSFVSFETNVSLDDYTTLIHKVLAAFKPTRFIITHLANALAASSSTFPRGFDDASIVTEFDFRVTDDIYCRFEHYDLYFMQFYRASAISGQSTPVGRRSSITMGSRVSPKVSTPTTPEPQACAAQALSDLAKSSLLRSKRRLDENGSILKPLASPNLGGMGSPCMVAAAHNAGVGVDKDGYLLIPGLHPTINANQTLEQARALYDGKDTQARASMDTMVITGVGSNVRLEASTKRVCTTGPVADTSAAQP